MRNLTTNEQARADAMADAETLMAVAMDRTLPVMPEWKAFRSALWAAHHGADAATAIERGSYLSAANAAACAARAAFCAVPGLRGEE